jgi:aminoglycoside phosphotransferase (APT) family kinase protein
MPDESYPWKWSVQTWIDGDPFGEGAGADPLGAAEDLADFVRGLQTLDPGQLSCPPPPSAAPLSASDAMVRKFAPRATGIDVDDFLAVWEQAINLPQWTGEPVLLHGDLRPDNLLVRDRRLAAVIDWAGVAVGDPAIDLAAAWWVFTGEARRRFRETLPFDEGTWLRAQAAPLGSVVGIVYYAESNPPFAAALRRTLTDVLAEWPRPLA